MTIISSRGELNNKSALGLLAKKTYTQFSFLKRE
jgi:hypothetical protein